MIAFSHRGGAHRAGVGACVGLRLREGGLLLAAQHREQILLLLRVIQREQHVPDIGAEHAWPARRHCDGAGDLLPDHHHAEKIETLAAVLLRHVEMPQPELLGLFFERCADLRPHVGAGHRRHLDRDQLAIDKVAHGLFEKAQFLGQFDMHLTRFLATLRHVVPAFRTCHGAAAGDTAVRLERT